MNDMAYSYGWYFKLKFIQDLAPLCNSWFSKTTMIYFFLFLGLLLTQTMINILYATLEIAISDCVLFFWSWYQLLKVTMYTLTGYLLLVDEIKKLVLNFRYCEKATKFEKKYPTFIWNYLVMSKQSRRFFSKLCGLLRISEL